MKKLLVTLNINDYDKDITEITFPYMREYAKNIDADFYIITERKFSNFSITLEKFQIYEISEKYDRIIFLDADCIINPKTKDLTTLIDRDRILVSSFNPPDHHFYHKNINGEHTLKYYVPFHFLVFSKETRNCVKPYSDIANYYDYINLNSSHPEMKKYMSLRTHISDEKNKEILLDEFFLSLNIHKHCIKCASLKEDYPELNAISHISDTKENKMKLFHESAKFISSFKNNISYS